MEENSKELKEKLFNQKELGWNSINDREKEAIYTFSNGYMNFLNKAKIERENRKRILCTPAFLPEAKVSVFTLVLFAEVYSAGSRVHGLNDG